MTRRDLLLQIADLDRYTRAAGRGAGPARGLSARGSSGRGTSGPELSGRAGTPDAAARLESAVERNGVWGQARSQSQTTRVPDPVSSVQLTLDLGDAPSDVLHSAEVSGLPEMDAGERVRAELEVLGLDASRHVMEFYGPFLDAVGVTRATGLLDQRSRSELLVAGVKVATQTPPIRSGRRVVFLTLDDATGPVDVTFFEDALGPFATTVFHSWLLVVRGELRRTGRRGVSLRATGCWELGALHELWRTQGAEAVHRAIEETDDPSRQAVAGPEEGEPAARRVLVHSTGFRLSPYADIKPAGGSAQSPPRKLWHSSPGSSGR